MQALLWKERLQIPSDLKGARKNVLASGADLTVRLHEPQFGLGFTNAIFVMHVDYSSQQSQHTNSGVMPLRVNELNRSCGK
jgi:hypothetical protein